MKRLFKVLSINLALFGVLLLGLEFTLQAVLGPVYVRSDPKWMADGHSKGRFQPNSVIVGGGGHNVLHPQQRQIPAKYKLNSLGFRGGEWTFSGAKSNVFFGGSSTFNFHDNDDDIWPYLVNKCVEQNGARKLQYVNLSHPGYSVENAPYIFMQIAQHLNPENIFVYHAWNDLKFASKFARRRDAQYFAEVPTNGSFLKQMLLDLGLFPNIVQRLNMALKSQVATENAYPNSEVSEENVAFAVDFIEKHYELLIKLAGPTRKIYIIKQGLFAENDAHPNPSEVMARLQSMTLSEFNAAAKVYFAMLDEVAARHANVQIIDANAKLEKTAEVFNDHVHLQTEGNKALAQIICAEL